MSLGLVGRKVGMTRIFTDDGDAVPVTVLDVSNNRVTQIKTPEKRRLCRGAGRLRQAPREPRQQARRRTFRQGRRRKRVTCCREFRVEPRAARRLQARRRGRRRHLQGRPEGGRHRHHRSARASPASSSATTSRSNRASHGNSVSHNEPGSIGQNQDPGRVFPGQAHGRSPGRCAAHGRRTWRWCASTPSASCCWSRARCPAPRAATWSCVPPAQGEGVMELQADRRAGSGDRERRRVGRHCSGATTTKRWCTRS